MAGPTATGTYLDRIVANTAREVAFRKQDTPLDELRRRYARRPAPVPLADRLQGDGVQVVAEFKRASPSKGDLALGASAREVVGQYLEGGAAALSVLTDHTFFAGSREDLEEVAALAHAWNPSTPVLCKDFVVDGYQLHEAYAHGADVVLLIAAVLDDPQLSSLAGLAADLGLEVLFEVHDAEELERVLPLRPRVVGVNNRDLTTFDVALETTEALAARVPDDVVLVSESGVHSRSDLARLAACGVHAVLVGESLMRRDDRATAVRALLGQKP